MAAGRAADRSPDGAAAGAVRGVAPRPQPPHASVGQGADGQLSPHPGGVRRRRSWDEVLRRPRFQPPRAVRAHLPPPPSLPDHRGRRRDPNPPSGPASVQVRPQVSVADELAPRLAAVLEPALGSGTAIEDLRTLTGGASRTTWAFNATTGSQRQSLILRIGPPDDVHAGMELEARAPAAPAAVGAPVPPVLVADDSVGP